MNESLLEKKKALIERLKLEGFVKDEAVIRAFMKVPREDFVPDELRDSAYDDRPLPIPGGQTISAPHREAY
ncbi:MAG: hypothetical protein QXW47_00790 [Candidatus Jordarchaeales archaeon]